VPKLKLRAHAAQVFSLILTVFLLNPTNIYVSCFSGYGCFFFKFDFPEYFCAPFFFFYLIRLLLVSHSLPDQVLNIIDYFLKGELV
jgi:hypothetical protein